jgi:hypothetical protein
MSSLMLNPEFILYIEFTTLRQKHIQHVTLQVPLNILQIKHKFLQIQTLVFQHWSERQVKAELSSTLLNPCPSNASYSQGETIKGSFLSLSLSHWYHWLCRPNPAKLTPRGKKKNLNLNPPNWTALLSHAANSRDLSYPEILTGAPNGEGREDRTYKLSKKKNHIRRVVNPTLT